MISSSHGSQQFCLVLLPLVTKSELKEWQVKSVVFWSYLLMLNEVLALCSMWQEKILRCHVILACINDSLRVLSSFIQDIADIRKQFPVLAEDVQIPEYFEKEQFFSSVFRISSAGLQLWTHYDVGNNMVSIRCCRWHCGVGILSYKSLLTRFC